MNIVVIDIEGHMSPSQCQQIHDRLFFAMARFAHCINGVTAHITRDNPQNGGPFFCSIYVNIQDRKIVSAHGSAGNVGQAVGVAIEHTEAAVSRKIRRSGWVHAERLVQRIAYAAQRLRWSLNDPRQRRHAS